MEIDNFRDRALELRAFIKGYITAKNYGVPEYTSLTLTFLDDFLLANPEFMPPVEMQPMSVDASTQAAEAPPIFVIEHVPEVDHPESSIPVVEEKSDEDKTQAFLAARAANHSPADAANPPGRAEKVRRAWTPEARAAAAERMRARQAAGLMKRRGGEEAGERTIMPEPQTIIVKHVKSSDPTPIAQPAMVSLAKPLPLAEPPLPHRLTVSHPDWAGKREDNQLHDSDWPDIKDMVIKGRTHLSIASDFDVEPETLKAFIETKLQQNREKVERPPGEPQAPAA